MVTAGFHRVDITPPAGVPLAGFAAREGVSIGAHDPLFVRALVLENAGCALAFVSVDVLGIPADFVRAVRERITASTRLGPEAVMISATHSHAAPVTISTFFNPGESLDQNYMNRLASAIENAVSVAWTGRRQARVGVGSGRVGGIAMNRRTSNRLPVDEQVGIIRVDAPDGTNVGVLINYACHPTVLGPDNLLATGDVPAFTLERVEQQLGAGSFALFVNGAQGNVSVGHSSELSAIGVVTPGRTFERATDIGHQLAAAALEALPSISTADEVPLSCATARLELPFRRYPPSAETAAVLREKRSLADDLERSGAPAEQVGRAKTERLYASIRNFYAGEAAALSGGPLSIELQAFRIGPALFAAVPLEVFVEIGLRIKRAASHPLFIMGVTNGYFGYLPTRDAYAAGGYEVVSAKVTDAAEDLLVGGIQDLDRRLFPGGC